MMTLTYDTSSYGATSTPEGIVTSRVDSDTFSEQDTHQNQQQQESAIQNEHSDSGADADADIVSQDELAARKRARCKKITIALIFVGLIVFIIVDSLTNRYVATGIQSFLQWLENNPVAGLFGFMAVYFLATVLFVPGSILTLGAGFVFASSFGLGFGVLLATISVFLGAAAGDITAFLLGRYLLRDWVQGWTVKYPIFKAIDKGL